MIENSLGSQRSISRSPIKAALQARDKTSKWTPCQAAEKSSVNTYTLYKSMDPVVRGLQTCPEPLIGRSPFFFPGPWSFP